jgi:hypothetical protein
MFSPLSSDFGVENVDRSHEEQHISTGKKQNPLDSVTFPVSFSKALNFTKD